MLRIEVVYHVTAPASGFCLLASAFWVRFGFWFRFRLWPVPRAIAEHIKVSKSSSAFVQEHLALASAVFSSPGWLLPRALFGVSILPGTASKFIGGCSVV